MAMELLALTKIANHINRGPGWSTHRGPGWSTHRGTCTATKYFTNATQVYVGANLAGKLQQQTPHYSFNTLS